MNNDQHITRKKKPSCASREFYSDEKLSGGES